MLEDKQILSLNNLYKKKTKFEKGGFTDYLFTQGNRETCLVSKFTINLRFPIFFIKKIISL